MKRIALLLVLIIGVLAGLFAGTASAASIEEEVKHYSSEYCFGVYQHYKYLQKGYDVPAKNARIIRSEMKKCNEVRAAYEKKYPPGKLHTTIAPHPGIF